MNSSSSGARGVGSSSRTYHARTARGSWKKSNSQGGSLEAAGTRLCMTPGRRSRYLAFFYCNFTSFVASILASIQLRVPEKICGHYKICHRGCWPYICC
ncbi:hypothetical protein BS78_K310600 [Paspalum vaginatum]|uniref:Uncharacterized protein n=1 Tax=Paspalum vaginatum TaxID=158149 RepID=A0A9W7XAB2_9POAL|nr:hypothetical protein BS78_K310600 [Paspalum vaginatum]